MSRARGAAPWMLLAAATFSLAAIAAPPPELGQREYLANCSTCHGRDGRGNGPTAGFGAQAVPDLTTLSSRNGHSFPYLTVYETIEGTHHGLKAGTEMPKWSALYGEQAEQSGPEAPYDVEGYVRTRIIAITQYLEKIQD